MKALVQRVTQAHVDVDGQRVGEIGLGLMVLVCAEHGDDDEAAQFLARKIARLRIFRDEEGRMNRSILDAGGAVLAVSQFTLAARWRKGNRPGFSDAAAPAEGERLYDVFCAALAGEDLALATGRFGAEMAVGLINDGPVTIWLDTQNPR